MKIYLRITLICFCGVLILMGLREILIFSLRINLNCGDVLTIKKEVLEDNGDYKLIDKMISDTDSFCKIIRILNEETKNYSIFAPDRNNKLTLDLIFVNQGSENSKIRITITQDNDCFVQTFNGSIAWNVFKCNKIKTMIFEKIE